MTGATGFVGGHLVSALLARGDRVSVLVRTPAKALGLESRGVELVAGDLSNMSALAAATAGADVVYHLAGAVAAVNEATYLVANRDGTANVVRAAEASGVTRLVYLSSMAAGGPSRRGTPWTDGAPAAPVTAYGRSKLAGERVVEGSALQWITLRAPAIYGPNDRDNFIKLFRMLPLGVLPVFGDGSQELSAIYAPDLAEALLAASPTAIGQGVYYVNHPEIVTSRELIHALATAAGRRVRVVPLPAIVARLALLATGTAARVAGQNTILNADKAHEFLAAAWTADPAPFMHRTGWQARHGLTAGLAATYRWYQTHGWL